MKKHIFTFCILLACTTLSAQNHTEYFFKAAGTPVAPRVQVSWNRYHTPAGFEKICRELAAAHPGLVKLESIGKSVGGRDIWLLTVTDFKKGGEPHRKPAMWVDGNIHGNEIQCGEIALYTAWYLAESFADTPFIQELLEQKTFYIVPTTNPDARAVFTESAGNLRTGLIPLDNDRDGSFDEDDAEDLDGDGFITQMRRKNPNGRYIPDPRYPNRLALAPIGQSGEYELLGAEGIDNDGDGVVNEDGPGGYDPNRDFGRAWQPNFIQHGAMKYPFSLPESRAVSDFILSHPNIAGMQSFHNSGGWFLAPPSTSLDAGHLSAADRAVYDAIGKKGEEIIPDYGYVVLYRGEHSLWGGQMDWAFFGRGIFEFSNEIWSRATIYQQRYKGDPENKHYEFDRTLLFGDGFADWTAYDHPQYGKIEIGGFKKTSTARLNPGFLLETEAHRNAAFVIYHAWNTPHLTIGGVREVLLEGGYRQITAEVTNLRLIPTHTSFDVECSINRPDRISISGPHVIAGMVMKDADRNQGIEQKHNPQQLAVENIPGGSTVTVRWIVKGNERYIITVDSAKGGITNSTPIE